VRAAGIVQGLLPFAGRVSWEASAGLADLERALQAVDGPALRASGARRISLFLEDGDGSAGPAVADLLRAGLEVRVRIVVGRSRRDGDGVAAAQRAARELLALPGPVGVELRLFEPWPGTAASESILSAGKAPHDLAGWAAFHPDDMARAWLPAPLVARVRRAAFYVSHASLRPRRRLGQRLVHRLARARVRTGFYGLDVERRVALALRRTRAALRLEAPAPVED
jgi:hypothetical protein